MSIQQYIFKIIIIGSYGVGKTSLLDVYMGKKFDLDYKPSIGVNIFKKEFPRKNLIAKVNFWDIAGQTMSNILHKSFFEGSNGVVLVFDVTREESFESLPKWYSESRKCLPFKDVPGVLIGNKVDLERKITYERAKEYADKISYYYIETSVKENKNVILLFEYLLNKLLPQ